MAEEKQTQKVEEGKEKKIVEESKKKETEKKTEVPKKTEVKPVPVKEVEVKKEIEKPAEPKKAVEEGQEYVIPLRKRWKNVPRYKRAKKAVKSVKEFLVRHMKVRDGDLNKIKIDKYLNEAIWARGIRKPLSKVKVRVVKDGEVFRAELSEMPEKLKFKKARLERRAKKAEDLVDDRKKTSKKLEDKVQETPTAEESKEVEEKKKEESEKKASVIEAGEQLGKKAAKQVKHQAKAPKGPKRPQRKALAK